MERKNFITLIVFISLLAICIALMSISLLVSEKTFGIVSSYIAIGCVAVTLIGIAVVIFRSRRDKKSRSDDPDETKK